MEEVVVHPHALKHGLSKDEIRYAWESSIVCRQRNGENDPIIWIVLGVLPNGRMAEMVAFEDEMGVWHVFHAMTPPTKKFLKEIGMGRR